MTTDSTQLVYSLQTDTGGRFDVDRMNGVLRTLRPLHHEDVHSATNVNILIVCVSVADAPSLFDCTNVTVELLDDNDNRPNVVLQV